MNLHHDESLLRQFVVKTKGAACIRYISYKMNSNQYKHDVQCASLEHMR